MGILLNNSKAACNQTSFGIFDPCRRFPTFSSSFSQSFNSRGRRRFTASLSPFSKNLDSWFSNLGSWLSGTGAWVGVPVCVLLKIPCDKGLSPRTERDLLLLTAIGIPLQLIHDKPSPQHHLGRTQKSMRNAREPLVTSPFQESRSWTSGRQSDL